MGPKFHYSWECHRSEGINKLRVAFNAFLIIGTKQQLNKVNIKTFSVGDSAVAPAAMARNLGVLFDENMTLLPHINNTCKTAFYYIHNIRSIRKYPFVETTRTLVHAVVIGRLDNCHSLFYGLQMKSISKLQRVQNAAARLITNTPRNDHVTPVLRSLHWLPVKERGTFKILTLSFKAIHDLAPDYIQSLVTLQCPSRYSLRRNNERFLKPYGRKTLNTLGDRAFAVAAPHLFNALPRYIIVEDNFNRFKTLVKTFLFNIANNI